MCTVLLRLSPDGPWPVLLGAIRDEFVERTWDPPAHHWPEPWADLVGGRDHVAGGTWLAVDPERRTVAALLNGAPLDPPVDGLPRPTRGDLALRALAGEGVPEDLSRYARFHLLRAGLDGGELWTWDGEALTHAVLDDGDHLIVNAGLDTDADPLIPHFRPLLASLPSEPSAWHGLLAGDDLEPGDVRALVVRKVIDERTYGTTSGALIALGRDEVRYDFTATPADPTSWRPVLLGAGTPVPPSP